MAVLTETLEQAQKWLHRGAEVHFIFDLDSTLFCVSPRTEQILKDFAQIPDMRMRYPEGCQALAQIQAQPDDWGIRSILDRHQIKETLSFFEHLRAHWVDCFFSSRYLHLDQPYPGAVEFVNECHQRGIAVGYLTGRDEQRMKSGTIASLEQHGLPTLPPGGLNMKPSAQYEDGQYKVDFFKKFSTAKDLSKCWFFENEPVILNKSKQQFPQLNCVFMNSVHSGREQVAPEVPSISFSWSWTSNRASR